MRISTSDLQKISTLLIKHIEARGVTTFDLDVDYYWDVDSEKRYDPTNEPKDFTLGQLYDDWDNLQKILNGELPPVSSDLVYLSAILRRLGEIVIG